MSVIIPTYNECYGISSLIESVLGLEWGNMLHSVECEVIVVDDSSPDGTGELCCSLMGIYPALKVVIRECERGLATAIRRGIEESRGDILVIMDADMSHDPDIIPSLVEEAVNGVDIAIASRYIESGEMNSSRHLVWGSCVLNSFIRTLLRIPVKDVTGGFIALRRNLLDGLDLESIFKGYGDYCFVLLYQGCRKDWRMKEIGFAYHPRRKGMSKTGFFQTGFSYGLRALKLRMGWE